MELEVEALQALPEEQPEVGLWPCTDTCGDGVTCKWSDAAA